MVCTCPPAEPEHHNWGEGTTRERRPDYARQQERRRRVVAGWLAHNGVGFTPDGRTVAICPDCRQPRASWVADHVVPIALGGDEDGELRVHCKSCSNRQGGRVANEVKRRRREQSA